MTHGSIGGIRDDPVILLGMAHSGTSIFAEVLHRHGVYMQADWFNYESKIFTHDIQDSMIIGVGGGWTRDPIMPVDEVMSHLDEVRAKVEGEVLKTYVSAGYDGRSRWGFKDPRACITLPLFLEIFPNAQLLHIVRDEADVAESIASQPHRQRASLDRLLWRSIHRQHVERAREYGRRHGDYFEFAYEDFCRRPLDVAAAAFAHINVPVTPELAEFLERNVYTHRIGIAEARGGSQLLVRPAGQSVRLVRGPDGKVMLLEGSLRRHVTSRLILRALEERLGPVQAMSADEVTGYKPGPAADLVGDDHGRLFFLLAGERLRVRGLTQVLSIASGDLARVPLADDELDLSAGSEIPTEHATTRAGPTELAAPPANRWRLRRWLLARGLAVWHRYKRFLPTPVRARLTDLCSGRW